MFIKKIIVMNNFKTNNKNKNKKHNKEGKY